MATNKFTSQTGFEFPMPEFEFFRTDDPDNIYRRTPQGIEAFSTRIQPDPTKPATQALSAQELAALPKFSSGIITDLARTLGQPTLRVTGPLTPELKAQLFQKQVAPSISQPLDAQTAALIKTGGAGLGGFQAGGQAGIQAGQALSETPQALQNRIAALQADLARLTPAPPVLGTAITGQALAPVPKPQLVTPSPTLVSPASGIPAGTLTADTTLQPTQQETEISNLIKKITEGSAGLVGQTGLIAEQQKAQGLEGLLKTQADLNAKLQLLKANEANIPLQILQQSVGGGITTAIANRLTDAALRENAINANIIGAQLAGIQGQISTANALIENAVRMKFGQKEEEQKALTDTLNLLLKDPALSLADKRRTNIQLQIQKAKDAQIERDKDNYEATQKEILKYPQASSAVRDEMSKETTPVGVQNVAKKYGLQAAGRAPGVVPSAQVPIINPVTGTSFTVRPNLTAAERGKVNDILGGEALINQLKELYYSATGSEFAGPGSGIWARIKGLGRWVGKVTGTNEAWNIYQRFLDSNMSVIAKGLKREVGVLTEGDVARAAKSFPGKFSSPKEARAAFDTLSQQLKDGKSLYGAISEPEIPLVEDESFVPD